MEQLTRFEKTRIIAARTLQISMGAPILIKIHDLKEPRDIARAEFEKEALPLTILRE